MILMPLDFHLLEYGGSKQNSLLNYMNPYFYSHIRVLRSCNSEGMQRQPTRTNVEVRVSIGMCGRGTLSWVQFLPLKILGLPSVGGGRCSQAPREAMGENKGPCHGGVSWLSRKKKANLVCLIFKEIGRELCRSKLPLFLMELLVIYSLCLLSRYISEMVNLSVDVLKSWP